MAVCAVTPRGAPCTHVCSDSRSLKLLRNQISIDEGLIWESFPWIRRNCRLLEMVLMMAFRRKRQVIKIAWFPIDLMACCRLCTTRDWWLILLYFPWHRSMDRESVSSMIRDVMVALNFMADYNKLSRKLIASGQEYFWILGPILGNIPLIPLRLNLKPN